MTKDTFVTTKIKILLMPAEGEISTWLCTGYTDLIMFLSICLFIHLLHRSNTGHIILFDLRVKTCQIHNFSFSFLFFV